MGNERSAWGMSAAHGDPNSIFIDRIVDAKEA
jgi:hypothetical protein